MSHVSTAAATFSGGKSTCRPRPGVAARPRGSLDLPSDPVRRRRRRTREWPWRRLVSETNLGRALEFMRYPQDVEVHRGGNWGLGSMIGWRQEEGGSCRVMLRVVEDGVEKTVWADLRDVRLAEHGGSPPTESLPFLPRLPDRPTEQQAWSATDAGPDELGLPDTSCAGSAHAGTGPPWLVSAPADDVRRGSGRRRASAAIDHGVRTRESGQRETTPTRVPVTQRDPRTWMSPSSGWPSSGWDEVEPTRLLELRQPRHR